MNSAWMLSSLLVSALVGVAASACDHVVRLRRGAPLRWIWATAMALSVSWSAYGLMPVSAAKSTAVASLSASAAGEDQPRAPMTTAGARTARLIRAQALLSYPALLPALFPTLPEEHERWLNFAAIVSSCLLFVALLWSLVRLLRERRDWKATELLGTAVLVSRRFGPAVVGIFRPAIVVPPWVLSVDTDAQRTILWHEQEHRRAGDQRLLLASYLVLILAPWNAILWLMCRRLARAIELDCDERVLARGVSRAAYANVLLTAWQHAQTSSRWVPSPALAQRASRLGRRVEHLMRPSPRSPYMQTIAGGLISLLFVGAALCVPSPRQAQPSPPSNGSAHSRAQNSRVKILMVAPLDSIGVRMAETAKELLAPDAAEQPVDRVVRADFLAQLDASGLSPRNPISFASLPAIGQSLYADVVLLISANTHRSELTTDIIAHGNGPFWRGQLRPASRTVGSLAAGASSQPVRAPKLRGRVGSGPVEGPVREKTDRVVKYIDPAPQPTRPAVVFPGTKGPEYPADLRDASISGDVVARFVVDVDGRANEITIVASDRPQFSTAVLDALRTMKFLAADRAGVRFPQRVDMAFQFSRTGTRTSVSLASDTATVRVILSGLNDRLKR